VAARRIQALHVDSTAGRDLSKAKAKVEEMQTQLKAKVFSFSFTHGLVPACAAGREVGVALAHVAPSSARSCRAQRMSTLTTPMADGIRASFASA
jgi:hypothetical protein